MGVSVRALGFGTTMLASAALNSLFVTYYLEMFTRVAELDGGWFFVGQTVFMLWNMLNDPLFGWLTDRGYFSPRGTSSTSTSVLNRRLGAIRGGGWLWALAYVGRSSALIDTPSLTICTPILLRARRFMCVWWTPGPAYPTLTGMYCIAVLCFYDGMLSFVEVNHSALLAEIGSTDAERAEANMWAAICAAVGSAYVGRSHRIYRRCPLPAPAPRSLLRAVTVRDAVAGVLTHHLHPILLRACRSTFFSHIYWDAANLMPFRLFCLAMAAVAVAGFEFTARTLAADGNSDTTAESARIFAVDGVVARLASSAEEAAGAASADGASPRLRRRAAPAEQPTLVAENVTRQHDGGISSGADGALSFGAFLSEMASSRNFRLFSLLNLLQIFDCTFEKNFLGLFLASYAGVGPAALSAHSQGLVISFAFVLPWACTVFITPLVKRVGVYATVSRLLKLRVAVSIGGIVVALCTGRTSWYYLLVNRVTSELVCRLMPLVKCDLVDEDAYVHDRVGSLSAAVVGSAEIVGKAGQSLAPMLGFALFTLHGRVGRTGALGGGGGERRMLLLALAIATIPLVIVSAQHLVWRAYSLQGEYLRKIKSAVASRRRLIALA